MKKLEGYDKSQTFQFFSCCEVVFIITRRSFVAIFDRKGTPVVLRKIAPSFWKSSERTSHVGTQKIESLWRTK